MGPIRCAKNRKKGEKKYADPAAAAMIFVKEPNKSLDWWNEFSLRHSGSLSDFKDSAKFESVLNISRKTFDYICSLVKEDMTANYTDLSGRPLSLNDRVAVALRRLSSGESFISIGNTFGINKSTVAQVSWRFVESMEKRALHHLQWPSTETEMIELKSKMEKIRGLPNCCGAIDITHIVMTPPAVESDIWLDHGGKHSITLQAIVDPEMRFRDVIIGWPGSLRDSTVLKSSGLFKRSEEGSRLNGKKMKLSQGVELCEYIVGDAGFPNLPWLLTPYQGIGLSELQTEFNKHHYATRLVAQRALAKLKHMWKITQGVMWKPDKNKLPRIIFVCCLLHNILIDLDDDVQDEMPLSHYHDPGYQQQICESFDETASIVKDSLSLYLYDNQPHKDISSLSSEVGNPCS